MLSRILVPLDGSPLAEAVLSQVMELAALPKPEILLLRVALAHTFPGVDPVEAQVRAVEEAQAYLAGIEPGLSAQGFTVKSAVRYGHAAEEILDHARVAGADLIAMSTHGRSGFRRWVLGSVAETVARHSPIPVLLLRDKAATAPAAEGKAESPGSFPAPPLDVATTGHIRHILCPVALTPTARGVLEYAGILAQRFGADLTVLHAIYDPLDITASHIPHPPLEQLRGEMIRVAEERLRGEMRETLGAVPRASLVVVAGSPFQQITRFARAHGVDLIVLGSTGQTGLDRLITGSTAEQVVRTAHCPVFTVRLGT
jgi:nucleotide-binding universal stress UspA family protein